MSLLLTLLDTVPSIVMESGAGEAAANAAQTAGAAAGQAAEAVTQAAQRSGGGFGTMGLILYIVVLVGIFYFFAIRPSKKREKELKNMQEAIKVGDDVMTSSGFYGKVTEVNDQIVVVEFGTNRGIRIPVKKSEIYGNKAPNMNGESES